MIVFLFMLVWFPGSVLAEMLCEDATTTAMEQPPQVRQFSFFVPPLANPNTTIAITSDGGAAGMVEMLAIDMAVVESLPTRDRGKVNEVATFNIAGLATGMHTGVVHYKTPPSDDAIIAITCTGVNQEAPVVAIDKTATVDTRETLTIAGDNAATVPLSIVREAEKSGKPNLRATIGGLSVRTYNRLEVR